MPEPTVTECDGFTVTTEQTPDGIWTVTATDEDDEVLVQFTTTDADEVLRLQDNLAASDLSDLEG